MVNAVTEAALEASSEAAGRDNETSIEMAASQLFDEKARHARLACARVVRQQETERLTRQHSLPSDRVEQVREANAMRFGNREGTGGHRNSRDGRLRRFRGAARRAGRADSCATAPVGPLYVSFRRFGTVPRDADNSDELVRENASQATAGVKGFEPGSFALPGLSFCGTYPCEMLARLKTSLRTLENDQIKPLIKARIHDRAFE